MENKYQLELRKIYLQNFTHATHFEILLFGTISYARARTKLLRKNALEQSSFELAITGNFSHMEFRVFGDEVLMSSEIHSSEHVQQLFECPVDIEAQFEESEEVDLLPKVIYAAVNLVLDSKYCNTLYYEIDCGGYSIFKRINDKFNEEECVELIIEESIPEEAVLTIFEHKNNLFLPILQESFTRDCGHIVERELSVSNELLSLIKEYNRDGSGDLEVITQSFPIEHPVFSYSFSKCQKLISAAPLTMLRCGFFTVEDRLLEIAANEAAFEQYSKDFGCPHFIIKDVFYYDNPIPFLAFEEGQFASFVSHHIFDTAKITIFCNGESMQLKDFQFPKEPGRIMINIEPYRFELYGVEYVKEEIEDEEIEILQMEIVDQVIEACVEQNEACPISGDPACEKQRNRGNQLIDRWVSPESLDQLKYISKCWQQSYNSLQVPLVFEKKVMLSASDIRELLEESLDSTNFEAEACDQKSFSALASKISREEKIRLIKLYLRRICEERPAALQMLENEVIIQHLTRNVQERAANIALERKRRIAEEIDNCAQRIRELQASDE